MKIQVLGSGCSTCKNLYELTKKAAEEMDLKESVEYLAGQEGVEKIMEMGIVNSPVLAVNGKPVMTGFTPDVEKIKSLLKKAKGKKL